MKLVWCPETASKAFIDAVKALTDGNRHLDDTNVAELLSAMAGGWRAQLIVEAWSSDDSIATSLALQAAKVHAGGRHVCVVPDEGSASSYLDSMSRVGASVSSAGVLSGDADEVMSELEGVDLLVVDWRRRDAAQLLRAALPGSRGMVVVCKGALKRRCGVSGVFGSGRRVVRCTFLPIGSGVEVFHVGVGKGPSLSSSSARWIRHVDVYTKEEHVFRR